jgi:hypothetical protein
MSLFPMWTRNCLRGMTWRFNHAVPSGPLGKFGNTQSLASGPRQGALRREWHALSKKCNAELAQ